MFGRPGHDVYAIGQALSGATIGGFFCAGEIGPVGSRSFLHGFTATLALFPGAPDGGGD
jgi:small ligand-binding sensory domain FIST